MLQEAGFHPLEVIQAATRNGAEVLGMEDEIGAISVGRRLISFSSKTTQYQTSNCCTAPVIESSIERAGDGAGWRRELHR